MSENFDGEINTDKEVENRERERGGPCAQDTLDDRAGDDTGVTVTVTTTSQPRVIYKHLTCLHKLPRSPTSLPTDTLTTDGKDERGRGGVGRLGDSVRNRGRGYTGADSTPEDPPTSDVGRTDERDITSFDPPTADSRQGRGPPPPHLSRRPTLNTSRTDPV